MMCLRYVIKFNISNTLLVINHRHYGNYAYHGYKDHAEETTLKGHSC